MVSMISKLLKRIINVLSSYKLAYVILVLLLVLTFFGTLEQVDHGIFEVKQKYFHSIFLVHRIGGRIPLPLPGGGLLMSILLVNLLVGGALRIKKNRSRIGILTVHLGIGFLLVSGFITFAYSFEGHLTLFENQRSNKFQSYYDWNIVVTEFMADGRKKNHLISDEKFRHLTKEKTAEFHSKNLPFIIKIDRFFKNSQPLPKGPMFEVDVPVIDGYFLKILKPSPEAERNVPGAYITVIDKQSDKVNQGILWGAQRSPWVAEISQKHWSFRLQPKRWKLPFTIVLDKFTRELHPRTGIAKVFMSDVTKIENGVEQPIKISMNEPLRHKGYTLFQASWGPENARPGDPLFSTFAVVKNPADKYPEYACIIIGFGLFIHFTQKLFRYIKSQNRKRASPISKTTAL